MADSLKDIFIYIGYYKAIIFIICTYKERIGDGL